VRALAQNSVLVLTAAYLLHLAGCPWQLITTLIVCCAFVEWREVVLYRASQRAAPDRHENR
jgi:hypothetical protein